MGLHPALARLLKMRYVGRVRSLVSNFTKPRRLAVSLLGTFLAVVWLGNAIAGMLFREQYDPEIFRQWLIVMLAGYAGWHLIRVAWQKPETGLEWTEAEANALMAYPFSRRQLVSYRLVTVLVATTLKALIGTILLLPDLNVPLLGFSGLWLGLALVEMVRLACDLGAAALSARQHQIYRGVTVSIAAGLGMALLGGAISLTQSDAQDTIPVVFVLFSNLLIAVRDLVLTDTGRFLTAPAVLIVDSMTSDRMTMAAFSSLGASTALFWISTRAIFWLDEWAERNRIQREKRASADCSVQSAVPSGDHTSMSRLDSLVLERAGPVIWRQYMGARRYLGAILVAFIPAVLFTLMPMFLKKFDGPLLFSNFLGGLVFYTFVALPAALKFDFRRDFDHLMRLKLLPYTPAKIVTGQLVTPVVLTTVFQYLMIMVASLIQPPSAILLIASLIGFPILNYTIYAWENLIFLMFPQRLKQEGIEVFLRTTIVFTAKGIVFALMFVAIILWISIVAVFADNFAPASYEVVIRKGLFWSGLLLATLAIGLVLTRQAARRFEAIDHFPEGAA
ncbi:MAG: hypothetical protein KDA80_18210 [Planctomycetaceae bacterium]|nr:hypothetical protein [Planctomycetaceae bacterium]